MPFSGRKTSGRRWPLTTSFKALKRGEAELSMGIILIVQAEAFGRPCH
jgi:hypothetical protein